MKAEGIQPTIVTWNALIAAHARSGDTAGALAAYEEMGCAGETPNARTYGALLSALAAGGAAEAPRALKLYDEAAAAGLAVNGHCVSSLLTALARGAGRTVPIHVALSRAKSALNALLAAGGTVDVRVWSAAAAVSASCGDAEGALALLPRAAAVGIEADPYIISTVAAACRASPEHAVAALDAIEAAPPLVRTTVVLNAALLLISGTLGDFDRALSLVDSMAAGAHGQHARADAVSFNTIIGCAAAVGNPRTALLARRAMRAWGIDATLRTYSALSVALGRGPGGPRRVERQLAACRASGLKPDESLWSALVAACVSAGSLSSGFRALEAMRAEGLQPTTLSLAPLLDAAATVNDVQLCLKAARGAGLTGGGANRLVSACARAGLLDDMLMELRAAARRGDELHGGTLNAVLHALCRFQYAERALRVRAFMAQRGIPLSPSARNALAGCCAREGLVTMAHELALEAAAADEPLLISSASSVVKALCHAGMLDEALGIACKPRTPSQPADSAPLGDDQQPLPSPPTAFVLAPSALVTLATSCARARRLDTALSVAAALRLTVSSYGNGALALARAGVPRSERRVFYSALCEAACLMQRLPDALAAFDEAREDVDDDGSLACPCLPLLTLAALEASCKRAPPELEHKLYDVCAALRAGTHAARLRKLARPRKVCHHVARDV